MPNPTRERQAPWPTQTESPAPPRTPPASRRRRSRRRSLSGHVDRRIDSRDGGDHIADEAAVQAALVQCEYFSGNDVTSCYPNSSSTIPQHEFASFVWNSRLPQFAQTNAVNIYLLSATEQEPAHNQIILQWNDVTNPTDSAGWWKTEVNDSWWGDRGNEWNGTDIPFLFQWAIVRSDKTLDGSVSRLPIFTALQTTFADSVIASMSSTSAAAAASSASAASLSSALAASASSASAASASSASLLSHAGGLGGSTSTGTAVNPSGSGGPGSGNVQSAASSSFPHWAIAVIVVLGFLALLASGILAFFMMRRLRRRRNSTLSHRGSMGSATPMMRNAETGEPTSPVTASAYGATTSHPRPVSPEMHDGASTTSRVSDAALISGADAAVMADAFRAMLRKPNFAGRPVEEGESPESDPLSPRDNPADNGLLDRELAEEGRDIRSVGSSRGVRVETLSDAADDRDTVHDHPR